MPHAHVLVGRDALGYWLAEAGDDDAPGPENLRALTAAAFAAAVREREATHHPRWVFAGGAIPAMLLHHGVRLERCHDLELVGRLLATRGDADELARTGGASALLGAQAAVPAAPPPPADTVSLFELDAGDDADTSTPGETLARLHHQLARLGEANDGGALRLLAALESSGRLVAAELGEVGVPFDASRHDRILTDTLGARGPGGRPAGLDAAAQRVREALGAPRLHVDSPRDLLAALRRAGLDVASTSQWELQEHEHPAVAPLLHYKKLHRLFTANGWAWREAWVRGGRLRTEYVPGGVVTGRWATNGGGALQLPREVRGAVVADPGWKLIVADAAQLEPRILAALSRDARMARAGQARDMYQAFVDAGVVPTRQDAKIGLLGAMYGGTQGRSGELLPALERAYPRALRFVEHAARAGERGEQVATRLGRTSPWPPESRGGDRAWGRFTRNFVVQGTAAEWAVSWLARLRQRLALLDGATGLLDSPLRDTPHLVYFLHDEVVVHAPERLAEAAAREVEAAAAWAGHLLFPGAPVVFPVTVAVVDAYSEAK